jgi:hypothetical protein
MRLCNVPDCGRKHNARGLCTPHWKQWKAGLPLTKVTSRAEQSARRCSFAGCGRKHQAKGLCMTHYSQQLAGETLTDIHVPALICSQPDCGRPHAARGLCNAHWQQAHRNRPLLNPRKYTAYGSAYDYAVLNLKVDANGCWNWTGVTSQGYGVWSYKRQVRAHRAVYELYMGEILPKYLALDHRCRNRLCCNPEHLDPVTARENNQRMMAYRAVAARVAELSAENDRLRAKLVESGTKAA